MVYIDEKKYACATCIKGHRSSSCQHTDRPLIEVKKKGRPVTQCEHCRDLRKTKQVHVRCQCASRPHDGQEYPRTKRKTNVPPSPTFPNGLSDVPTTATVRERPRATPRVRALCDCDATGQCHCAVPVSSPNESHASLQTGGMLNSLVQAAAGSQPMLLGSGMTDTRLPSRSQSGSPKSHGYSPYAASLPQGKSCCAPKVDEQQGAPQLSDEASPWPSGTSDYPALMAALPDVSMYACGCGATCACPGCAEHRGPEVAAASLESCPVACASCFDCAITVPFQSSPIDAWLKPAPVQQQPTRAATYPMDSSAGPYANSAWMNVDVAPVTSSQGCCGGQCKCPAGTCQCFDDCCGCCDGCGCEEHREQMHFTGYQGSLRCGYQVSGERGSSCNRSATATPSPPAFSAQSYTPPILSPVLSPVASPVLSQQGFFRALNMPARPANPTAGLAGPPSVNPAAYISPQPQPTFPSRQFMPKSDTSAPAHSNVLTPVPFQPAPGNFTLGLPDPQFVAQLTQDSAQQALYSRQPPALYHSARTPSV